MIYRMDFIRYFSQLFPGRWREKPRAHVLGDSISTCCVIHNKETALTRKPVSRVRVAELTRVAADSTTSLTSRRAASGLPQSPGGEDGASCPRLRGGNPAFTPRCCEHARAETPPTGPKSHSTNTHSSHHSAVRDGAWVRWKLRRWHGNDRVHSRHLEGFLPTKGERYACTLSEG